MIFQVVIEFPPERDPVRQQHGLARLLDYARWVKSEGEATTAVRPIAPIVWACEEPIAFGLYEADDERQLHALVEPIHNALRVRIVPCKELDEVMGLAGVRLAAMRQAGKPAAQRM